MLDLEEALRQDLRLVRFGIGVLAAHAVNLASKECGSACVADADVTC